MIRWCVLVSVASSIACVTKRGSRLEDPSTQVVSSCANTAGPDTTVFDSTQVSRRPLLVSGPDLRYPDELRMLGQSGRVVFSLIVNKDGTPDLQSVQVVRSDDLRFEWAARDWLKLARFSPGCSNGHPVRVRINLPVDFQVRR